MSKWIAAIHDGLNGADSQRDARIELVIRLADGDLSRLPALAADLVTNHVEAIVAAAPPAVQAAKGATTSVPVIAIDLESDPVASGLVASLAHPGGNVSGVFRDHPDFSTKCLQLLIESIPTLAGVSPLFGGNPQIVADFAMRRNVPTISLFPDIAREGGLLAYIGQCISGPIGRRTVKTDPLPASLATVTSPPIMRASFREMASPSPVPP